MVFSSKIKQLSKMTLRKKFDLSTEFVKKIQAKTGTECLFVNYWNDLKKMEENEELVGDLISSQEENPSTHLSPREIEKVTGISRASVRRMVKRWSLKQFKRVKRPMMSSATQQWRTEQARALMENFSKKQINRVMRMTGRRGFYGGCSLQCSEQSCLWYE